jgi:hypothetical protein
MTTNNLLDSLSKDHVEGIIIIGKGASVDEISFANASDYIVINTNDSELIYPGDICVFHYGWVLDVFEHREPQCSVYITDKPVAIGKKNHNSSLCTI